MKKTYFISKQKKAEALSCAAKYLAQDIADITAALTKYTASKDLIAYSMYSDAQRQLQEAINKYKLIDELKQMPIEQAIDGKSFKYLNLLLLPNSCIVSK